MTGSHYLDLAGVVYKYFRLRRRKGLLGPGYIIRNLRFTAGRLFSANRTRTDSPLIATLAVTSRCRLNCRHCSEGYRSGKELSRETIFAALDDLVALGCPIIALTGGEPFLRADFLQLLDRVPPTVAVIIYSSGMGLTPEIAAVLRGRRALAVSFSIDHSDPAEHDRRRGKAGSHAAAMAGIEMLAGGAVEIHVSTLATRDRLESGELKDFIRGLKKKGVAGVQVFQPRPVGKLTASDGMYLRPEEELRFIDLSRELENDPEAPLVLAYPALERPEALGCCGGYARVYVDSAGNVCPCDFAPLSFGSIEAEPFREIWKRMRGFFTTPGNRCLVRDNPALFGTPRTERNVRFSELARPEDLVAPPPGAFTARGERFYRALIPNLFLANTTLIQRKGK